MMNNSGPRYKRSQLEKDINKDVIACVFILFTLCLIGGGLVILAAAIVIMSTCRIRPRTTSPTTTRHRQLHHFHLPDLRKS